MRANTDRTVTRVASEPKQTTNLSIDESALTHIMSVLTDMYSDPMLAVIREYASNARDSHLAAGVTEPIQVSLPTQFRPFYTVEDKGVGMTVDGLLNIYAKYGTSTKRDNDVESGMLGLGCKSALTYTDQFTVLATKDGVRASAVISRNEDGSASMDITDTVTTDEPNGFKVIIPVNSDDIQRFCERAKRFFGFWSEGSALVDGEEITVEKDIVINDDIFLTKSLDSDFVVMGEIGYNVGNRIAGYRNGYHAVARVKMGAVNFPPNRETLSYTDRTNKVLEALAETVEEGLPKAITRMVEEADSEPEAYKAATIFRNITRGDIKWRGQVIPQVVEADEGFWYAYPFRSRNVTESYSAKNRVYLATVAECVGISGYSNTTLNSTNRKKAEQYLRDNDIDVPNRIIFFDSALPGSPWVDIPTYDWDEVRKTKIKPSAGYNRNTRSFGGAYEVWDRDNGRWEVLEEVEADSAIIYTPANKSVSVLELSAAYPDHAIVRLTKNRWDKFKREFGEDDVMTVSEAQAAKTQEAYDSLSDEHKTGLAYSEANVSYSLRYADFARLAEVDDPELSNAAAEVQKMREVAAAAKRTFEKARGNVFYDHARIFPNLVKDSKPGDTINRIEKMLDKYPLVGYHHSYRIAREHVEYINALYTVKYKEKK